ncbi:MAG: hypothetical protein WCG23_01360 [bacterium]
MEEIKGGSRSFVYSFKANGSDYVIKILKENKSHTEKTHGVFIETNKQMFLSNKEGDKYLAKIYFSDFKNNFILSKKEKNVQSSLDKILAFLSAIQKKYKLKYTDFNNGNIINNKIVDFGGIDVSPSKFVFPN